MRSGKFLGGGLYLDRLVVVVFVAAGKIALLLGILSVSMAL